ncbi:DUF4249 domain-containing protein [Seonamhaeicola sediminis]|uniref:DUF4249 domain-containing protein n=1 Tax=Seonamhaeicola sediminis TaxID=2528206 RepID=A0A562YBZ5_9FLAO|nr:DUF4249 domain-containing protein [Seonamhaeicola sediminis]TWO32022.1 DUF4249 domain-containing protein [Seonamhaeicola sediminis]
MNRLIYIIALSLLIISCEDVIDVDLKTAETRLVIDASLSWEKGTLGNNQEIKLSLTAPYFSNTIPAATGATVVVTDSNNNTFNFIEQGNSGVYQNNTFIPEINGVYTLTVNYNNEIYTATESLKSVVTIDYVEQNNNGGFSGEDIEIKAFYTDPADQENYYLFQFQNNQNVPMLVVYDDEFTNGNQIFGFFSDDEMKTNDNLNIKISGISKRHYDYLFILLQQTDDESGDPFETQPATVRGNCINQTNPNNYPLGYFRISETDVFNYTVQ